MIATLMSIRFFIMMLETFFPRVSPAVRKAKPACMKNTSTPQSMMKTLSRFAWTVSTVSSCAPAGLAVMNTAARPMPTPTAIFVPLRLNTFPPGWPETGDTVAASVRSSGSPIHVDRMVRGPGGSTARNVRTDRFGPVSCP